jgi:hypothetical protein
MQTTKRLKQLSLSLTCTLLFCTNSHALVNGSFESGLSGWTFNSGVVISPFVPSPFPASHGTNAVELGINNIVGSVLSQTSSVTAGSAQTLTFDILAMGDPGRTGVVRVELNFLPTGGSISQSFTNAAKNTLPLPFQNKSIPFTVPTSATNMVLRFVDLSFNNGIAVDPIIDNVRIVPAPTNIPPLIITQPQSATVFAGTNVTFTVQATNGTPVLPSVSSGTIKLWLKADAGVITISNKVLEWQDQSINTNHAFQPNLDRQPVLANGGALFNNKPVVRFDGIRSLATGDFMHGNGDLNLSNAYTSFLVYLEKETNVIEQLPSIVGEPGVYHSIRGHYILGGFGTTNEMAFATWAFDYGSGFRIPINKSRIWTLRLNETKTQIEFFDTDGISNFTTNRATQGLITPAAGYYVGGNSFPSTQLYAFKGDIAEVIYFQGKLTDPDRVGVENYLRQKYFSASSGLFYQWLFQGVPIAGATNSSFTLNNVQLTNGGNYSVVVSNLFASVMSSNALLTVIQTNHVPVALSQSLSVNEDTALPIMLMGTDADGDPLTYKAGSPAHGTLSGTEPNLIYTPHANFHGTDSFNFTARDGKTDSAPATISINVISVNDAPVAFPQSVSVNEDNLLSITLIVTDADGDALTYSVTTPVNGTLSGTPPNLTYSPNANYHGTDSFTFKVNDGQIDSGIATISITVNSVNDTPVAVATATPAFMFSTNDGITVVIAPCDGNATVVLDASLSSDVENDPLQYSWMEGTNLLATGQVVTNFFEVGTHSIVLTVDDGSASGSATLVLEVITPAQAVAELILFVEESGLARNQKQPLLASLNAAAASFARCHIIPGINQLEAFQNKIDAQIKPLNPALAEELFRISEEIIAAIKLNDLKSNPQRSLKIRLGPDSSVLR